MEVKLKKCRSHGKAKGFNGCGKMSYNRVYGLCPECLRKWAYNTEQGHEYLAKTSLRKVRKEKKESRPKRKYIRWEEKSTKEMINYVQDELCNPYIRLRDIENGYRCISSNGVIEHAGHCFSVGSNGGLRFNVMNIHGQQARANTWLNGDFQNYKEGLIKRHGIKYFEKLEQLKIKASKIKQLDRDEVIRIGKTYKWLLENKQWTWSHDEFENYKNILNK